MDQGHYMINAIFLKYTGTDPSRPAYVAIKGTIFDVSKKDAYAKGGQYHGTKIFAIFLWHCSVKKPELIVLSVAVFAGKDSSRALAKSSLKAEDCRPEWEDLDDKEKTVLEEWYTFFSKRYNIVGKVVS